MAHTDSTFYTLWSGPPASVVHWPNVGVPRAGGPLGLRGYGARGLESVGAIFSTSPWLGAVVLRLNTSYPSLLRVRFVSVCLCVLFLRHNFVRGILLLIPESLSPSLRETKTQRKILLTK